MRLVSAVSFLLAIFLLPLVSGASDEEQGLKTLAVQSRQHEMSHEFSAWLGTLPLDAFSKGLTFTGAYTIHFNEFVAWEVGQFTYSYGIDTDLKADLNNLPNPVGPTPFEVVKYFVTSSVMLKPLYGKATAFNRLLIFGEMFIDVGAGYGWMTITGRPVVNVGVGARVYAGKIVSFRLDVRDYMFFNTEDLHNELWIALGICLGF